MAREAIGLVGAGVGFVIGGPIGAQIGFAVGSAVGGYLDPVEVPHPGYSEAPVQTGREGVDLPIPWGLVSVHGNVIDQGELYEVSKKRRSGKNSKVEEITRYKTFAIGLAAGPIDGVSRIWENGTLVYDINGSIDSEDHTDFASKITIYTGTEDQLPDSDLEVIHGVGNVPAYRGLAYVVFPDYDVTDFGGAIPQYLFELNGGQDLSASSQPYPIEVVDGVEATPAPTDSDVYNSTIEGVQPTITPDDSDLRSLLNEYDYEAEGVQPTVTPDDSDLDDVLNEYDYETEGIQPTITPDDSDLDVSLVEYDYETEGIQPTVTPANGTLT